jgi:hypothetical protein
MQSGNMPVTNGFITHTFRRNFLNRHGDFNEFFWLCHKFLARETRGRRENRFFFFNVLKFKLNALMMKTKNKSAILIASDSIEAL